MIMDSKPLPLPVVVEPDLPPPPPSPNGFPSEAPALPSKKGAPRPPQLDSIPSFSGFDTGLSIPLTPTTPMSPTSSSSDQQKPKKSNPLVDLIDTEKSYVDQLTGVIRKVAAAWSRSNLPPPDLDTMFRSIEGVYKANRSLLSKLREIGANPSSPKALGDLLMRWIDDLETPYTNYCTRYSAGFDSWEPVQSNARLPQALLTFSETNPPPPSSSSSGIWTLDSLFLLPKARLKYYRKLYSRLLKSTAPGRSDHRLLVGALEKLDKLLGTVEQREGINVGSQLDADDLSPEDEVVIGGPSKRGSDEPRNAARTSDLDTVQSSSSSSARGSSASGGERLSRETASTSVNRASSSTMTRPVADLERRLSTERTLDIFTMTPKAVRLQIAPPGLTYSRELRLSVDVTISFTPRATATEVVLRRGHIFLLSDLFLVCERMTPEERAQFKPDGPDMWLCYPPLAGKVLRLGDVPGEENAFTISIMRKETLTIRTESAQMRGMMVAEFKDSIEFASSVGPVSKQPPPPMPALNLAAMNGLPPRPISNQSNTSASSRGPPSRDSGGMSPPSRMASPSGRPLDERIPHEPDGVMRSLSHQPHGMGMGPPGPMQPNVGPPPGGPFGPGQVVRHMSAGHPPPPPHMMGGGPPPHFNQPFPPQGGPGHPHFHGPPPGQPFQGPPRSMSSAGPSSQTHPSYPGPPRPPSEPNGIRKSPSMHSFHENAFHDNSLPPLPMPPGGLYSNLRHNNSTGNLHAPQPRPMLPSQFNARVQSSREPSTYYDEPSPPASPIEQEMPVGPVTSTISAQMKCKVFLKQQHQQWKALGSAKLKLYRQSPTNIKQLVVEAENKDKSVMISTIVMSDGVERVGKTGVAIELSDSGVRTGIVYMIQLRNETSAGGLFDSLLVGSDRAVSS